eukprot:symbB.v1.2.034197.t1/scaffold4369.1/size40568/1
MPEAYLGLTTVMPDQTPERGNPGGPVAIAFVTGDLAHYATATGNQHLVFEILPGLDDTVPGAFVYRDTLLLRTNRLEPCLVHLGALPMAHCAVKYGSSAPAVPEECGNGEFHRSFDDRLWLFTRSWRPEGKTWATLMIVHGTVDHSGVYEELGHL